MWFRLNAIKKVFCELKKKFKAKNLNVCLINFGYSRFKVLISRYRSSIHQNRAPRAFIFYISRRVLKRFWWILFEWKYQQKSRFSKYNRHFSHSCLFGIVFSLKMSMTFFFWGQIFPWHFQIPLFWTLFYIIGAHNR